MRGSIAEGLPHRSEGLRARSAAPCPSQRVRAWGVSVSRPVPRLPPPPDSRMGSEEPSASTLYRCGNSLLPRTLKNRKVYRQLLKIWPPLGCSELPRSQAAPQGQGTWPSQAITTAIPQHQFPVPPFTCCFSPLSMFWPSFTGLAMISQCIEPWTSGHQFRPSLALPHVSPIQSS